MFQFQSLGMRFSLRQAVLDVLSILRGFLWVALKKSGITLSPQKSLNSGY